MAAATLVVAAIPGACAERGEAARLAALEASMANARASLAAVQTGAPAAPPRARAAGGGSAASRPVTVAVPAAAASAALFRMGAPPAAASALVGAEPEALRRWFGAPDLRRPEGDAEVRLYLGPGCALDVVLYAAPAGAGGGDGGGALRVRHAAARADGVAAVTEAECLRGIAGGAGGGRPVADGRIGGG